MRFQNLNQLIQRSSSTRNYFLSLPVKTQIELHEHNEYIHTAEELHHLVNQLAIYNRQVELSAYDPIVTSGFSFSKK